MGCFRGWRSGPSQEAAELAPGRPQTKSISSSQTSEARCIGPSQGVRSGQEAGQEGPGVPSPPRMTATRLHQDVETSEASCAAFLSGWTSWGAAVALLEAVGPAVVLALPR